MDEEVPVKMIHSLRPSFPDHVYHAQFRSLTYSSMLFAADFNDQKVKNELVGGVIYTITHNIYIYVYIYIIYIMVFDPAWDDDDPQLAPPLNLEPRCYTSCSTPRRTAPTHPRALWVTTGGTRLDRASTPTYLLVLISFL